MEITKNTDISNLPAVIRKDARKIRKILYLQDMLIRSDKTIEAHQYLSKSKTGLQARVSRFVDLSNQVANENLCTEQRENAEFMLQQGLLN